MLKQAVSWALMGALLYIWYWTGLVWSGFEGKESPYMLYALITAIVMCRRRV